MKKLIYKLIYKERATPKTYAKFLKKNCAFFGEDVYLANPHKITIDKDALHFIKIGNNVQILSGVTILAHDESYSVFGLTHSDYPRKQKMTVIGNNVFIGINSTVLMGSNIGDNVVIGAGSVVSGNVESNSVYAGNPAKKIMSLEEYYNKCSSSFEDSAYLYIKKFMVKYGRYPKIDELHMYRLLFADTLHTDLNKPSDVISAVINANKQRKKYKSIKEFLSSKEDSRILKKLQETECGMLDDFQEYFKKHGIKYSLTAGNMIGAIRHNGFIPWDDDIDINMTRNDLIKFQEAWKIDKLPGYTIEFECGKSQGLNHTKIMKGGTILSSFDEYKRNKHHGVWIDVSVMEKAPINPKEKKKFLKKAALKILFTRNVLYKKGNAFQLMASAIVVMLPYWIKKLAISNCNKTLFKYKDATKDFEYMELAATYLFKYSYPSNLFDSIIDHKYDDHTYKIYENYESYLRVRFGNYMELPPESERVCKHLPDIIELGD